MKKSDLIIGLQYVLISSSTPSEPSGLELVYIGMDPWTGSLAFDRTDGLGHYYLNSATDDISKQIRLKDTGLLDLSSSWCECGSKAPWGRQHSRWCRQFHPEGLD